MYKQTAKEHRRLLGFKYSSAIKYKKGTYSTILFLNYTYRVWKRETYFSFLVFPGIIRRLCLDNAAMLPLFLPSS